MVKRVAATLAVFGMAGCATAPMLPYQTGNDKFELNYRGSVQEGAERAQAFCRGKGFDYATVLETRDPELTTAWTMGVGFDKHHVKFVCMRQGETLGPSGPPPVITDCVTLGEGLTTCTSM